jgi:hypothetical protein
MEKTKWKAEFLFIFCDNQGSNVTLLVAHVWEAESAWKIWHGEGAKEGRHDRP